MNDTSGLSHPSSSFRDASGSPLDPIAVEKPVFTSAHWVFICGYVLFSVVMRVMPLFPWVQVQHRAWVTVLLYALLAIGGVIVFRGAFVRSWRLTRAAPWRTLAWLALSVVAAQVVQVVATVGLSTLGVPVESLTSNDDNAVRLSALVPAAVFIPTVALFGPVVEELVFRESMVHRARALAPTWLCVIVSSIVFGLIHVHSWAELPIALVYAASGMVPALILRATKGNLLVCTAEHVLGNSVGAIGALLL